MAEEAKEAGKKTAAKPVKKSVKKATKAERSVGAKKSTVKKAVAKKGTAKKVAKKAVKKASAKKASKATPNIRMPREERDAFVKQFYDEGGKGVQAFCDRVGIKSFNFNNWKKSYDEEHGIVRKRGRAAGTEAVVVTKGAPAKKVAKVTKKAAKTSGMARASDTIHPDTLIPLYRDGRKIIEVEYRHFSTVIQALGEK